MALLGTFGFDSLPDDEFDVTFTIPNNCNFTTHYDATKKINTITVQLNSGQSQPSGVFVPCNHTVSADNNAANINFEQKLNGSTITKPKIVITL
ncbi:hypothetical protein FSS13T_08050 [Flavobacterium saliperosum S13]|uniref:Uncharacterized protein n=2 Tax=Flavobacterium saliperosum TaxID=329186 RepID=A0A1G4W194_9FLAO|nr:hypothetical protein [Flavobacterium saliperosum]ESU27541.1 hypothetical protein FSS13T_08050 [Flavobacterium saliperosum S13]SCX15149.1 hypothetical protein SAMN02927925_02194 [Flavobacterium saliperosum]